MHVCVHYVYFVCVCVCICVHTYISLVGNGSELARKQDGMVALGGQRSSPAFLPSMGLTPYFFSLDIPDVDSTHPS